MNSAKIPQALKNRRQWVLWKIVGRGNDKPTKVPLTVSGSPASSTDPNTWTDFETAAAAAPVNIGFVFSAEDPFCGIDLDGCRNSETGEIASWAKSWIVKFNSYSEVSPSRTGVKIWVVGKWPLESGKKRELQEPIIVSDKKPAVEAYDHARYFAVTGMRLSGLPTEPMERQAELNEFCKAYFSEETRQSKSEEARSSRLSVIERARKYLDTVPGAVSGSGGHDQTFKAACILILGFGLTKQEALVLMADFNRRCEPPWSERELLHKLDSADKQPGDRGYLRDKNESEWKSVKVPDYVDPSPKTRQQQPSEPTITTLECAAFGYLDKISTGKKSLISMGMAPVDYAIGGGIEDSEMVIIAARPSHGKSAFGLQCLHSASMEQMPCAIISEEMSSLALGKRVVQYATRTVESCWLHEMDRVKSDVKEHFSMRAPCYIVEGCGTARRTREIVKRLHETKGVRLFAIDYAQLLTSGGKTRYEQITQTSIELRQIATEIKVTLLVLCQLSRSIEGRDKFIPRLEDLKDSGQLEQDADVILFLVWPYRLDTKKNPEEYQVWIGKNRNRPINAPEVDCQFDPTRQRIIASSNSMGKVIHEPRWSQAGMYQD